jgi:hypothetical protein
MTEFGKRKSGQRAPIIVRREERRGGALLVVAIVVITFLGAYAMVSFGMTMRSSLVSYQTKQPSRETASPLDFLKGRWVTKLAACSATDNYVEFGNDSYLAFVHGRRWADISNHVLYWRKGSVIFVKEDGNKANPILSLKVLDDDHIAFLNLSFEGEEDYDRGGPEVTVQPQPAGRVSEFTSLDVQLDAINRGTTVEDEWRQSFRSYLATLKRCDGTQTPPQRANGISNERPTGEMGEGESGAAEFLKGKWVSSNARCDATDNLASFSEQSFQFKIHGQTFGNNLYSPVSYSRAGGTISIGIGRQRTIAHIVFRVKTTDDIEFADFNVETDRVLHPEKEWAFTGNSISSSDALVTNKWHELFVTHLPRLKRCARKA